ncbi:MAG: GNAT family N-acetyltransferase [Anaerolineaceae bacterium]|nr:GNAT family N-acetyltransferase [Anaerolineaceae bacterium]
MDLTFVPVSIGDPLIENVKRLYETAFPAIERQPFSVLFSGFHGDGELFAFLDGDLFAGMIYLLSYGDITHILYLAIPENLHRKGYGSHILSLIRKKYPDQRIIADLESPGEGSSNADQRNQRIRFYRKNGYDFTGVSYRWRGEDYQIMSSGGIITGEELSAFWQYFYS